MSGQLTEAEKAVRSDKMLELHQKRAAEYETSLLGKTLEVLLEEKVEIDGKFTAKERAYLASLPAVESVSASHIRYADSFRIEVMCRYNAGESPAAIFREAGLDPKLIGYKRIERCIARWKKQGERDRRGGERANRDDLRIIRHHDLMGDDAQSSEMESQDMLSKLTQAQLIINQCDELIAKQALRIDELERVLRKLVG